MTTGGSASATRWASAAPSTRWQHGPVDDTPGTWQPGSMPRKKPGPSDRPLAPSVNLGDVLEEVVGDAQAAVLAAMEMERALLGIARDLAASAIRVADLEQEADRVAAAHRQAQLIVALYRELPDAVRLTEG